MRVVTSQGTEFHPLVYLLKQFLELGKSIIKETDGLFPDGLSVLNGQVIMNGLTVEEDGLNNLRVRGGSD